MLLSVTKLIFEIICFTLSLLLAFRVFFPNVFKNSNKLSPVMALLGGLFVFYILIGIMLIFIMPSLLNKIIILLFIISPFIIGKLVTYEKLKFYSIIQILCVILSLVFIITV